MRWGGLAAAEPEFAATVRARLTHHRHCIIATLRRDGAPRLSGIEAWFWEDDLMLGMMPDSRKAADLDRDARFELHSSPTDTNLQDPDARLWGTAQRVVDPATIERFAASLPYPSQQHELMDLFRADLQGALLARVEENRLVLESWRPGRSVRRHARR